MTHYTGNNKTTALIKAASLSKGTIVCRDLEALEEIFKVSKAIGKDIKQPIMFKDYIASFNKADIGPFLFHDLESILVDTADGFKTTPEVLACS